MRTLLSIALAAILAATHVVNASAETLTAKANTVNSVGFFYFYSALGYGCNTAGKPKVRILREPEHGTLRTEWRQGTLGKAGGCKGKPGKGLAVWYTPAKGYRGPDKFRFLMSVPGFGSATNSKDWGFKVTVE